MDFWQFCVQVRPAMVGYVRKVYKFDQDTAEDVVSRSFVHAFKNGGYDPSRKPMVWMRNIVWQRACEHVRRRNRGPILMGDIDYNVDHLADTFDTVKTVEDKDQARACVAVIERACQEVVCDPSMVVEYCSGQSAKEVGGRRGLSEAAAKSRICRVMHVARAIAR